jgi:hypothetical protein
MDPYGIEETSNQPAVHRTGVGHRTTDAAATESALSSLRSRSLAVLLTLATPTALTSLTSCSPETTRDGQPAKPHYSSLVTTSDAPGLPLKSVAARLTTLGELHGPVQDALVATISFSEVSDLGDLTKVNGSTASVLTLKDSLTSAHRALSNGINNGDLALIRAEIDKTASAVAQLMTTISSQEEMTRSWSRSALSANQEMPGIAIAVHAQNQMEQMVSALDADMAALIPGYELSRVVFFSEILGATKATVTAIGDLLKNSERDEPALSEHRKKIASLISSLEATQKDQSLTGLASGTSQLFHEMTKLHTSLSPSSSLEKLQEAQKSAQIALEQLALVEQQTQKDLAQRHYTSGGGVYIYQPWGYHWYGTGYPSVYSSWNGASGFNSTASFSRSAFAPNDGGLTDGSPSAKRAAASGKTLNSGFKGSSFGRAPTSPGFKTGGFGRTGASFGGSGIS